MQTTHRLIAGDARTLEGIAGDSVDLIVTSPPYPMIEMWDGAFAAMQPAIAADLERGRGLDAFAGMHAELDRAWEACFRVLKPGGFACLNIGDAARTIGGEFRLYPNHARLLQAAGRLGFTTLPDILWRKPTNAPNKFLGSGMLPAGAYVTYEHEYILIFRKGAARRFPTGEDRRRRAESAFFWEERNAWFSDVWMDLKGAGQDLDAAEARRRSGAFPFEVPYRLIQMYSLAGDTVLDPFAGTGTTVAAAAASARNGIGVEIDPALLAVAREAVTAVPALGRERARARLRRHIEFVREAAASGRELKHRNATHGFAVVTGQEKALRLVAPASAREVEPGLFAIEHQLAEAGPEATLVQGEIPLATTAGGPAGGP
jgi:DNA modification methylase